MALADPPLAPGKMEKPDLASADSSPFAVFTVEQWTAAINKAIVQQAPCLAATGYLAGPWNSYSRPVVLTFPDKVNRMVKGRQAGGRALFNDQVIGRLGKQIAAPVPDVCVATLPQSLIDIEPKVAHMPAGSCHACTFFDNYSDRMGVAHHDLPGNRTGLAKLAILYGWVYASDPQLIYRNAPPRTLLSVDHGHFLGDGPNWTPEVLAGRPAPTPHPWIVDGAKLTPEELKAAAEALRLTTNQALCDAIGSAPVEWDVPISERVALGVYLAKRRLELLNHFNISVS